MSAAKHFPPYELVDQSAIDAARDKTRKLERLYHLTQTHAWDGPAVFASLVEKHGPVGEKLDPRVRGALLEVLSALLWGELAAWSISADLALAIDDVDAKMAATGQVFDEARHFTVLRDYVLALAKAHGASVPRLGGVVRRLLRKVLEADTLAKKLIGMQLLFETNAVVIFRRLGESKQCPILAELMPYFERDESRHVGLGVLYLPRLIATMTTAEAASSSRFQGECLSLLVATGFVVKDSFAILGLEQRDMTERVANMQDDIVRQMVEAHGRGVTRGVLNPKASALGPRILDFVHPEGGIEHAPAWHRVLHEGLGRAVRSLDRALA